MRKNLFLKSFSAVITLSLCLLSQSTLGMDAKKHKDVKTSSNKPKKSIINKKLRSKFNESDIYVPDMDLIKLKPYLENLIQLTVSDAIHEERTIHFKLLGKDFEGYFDWEHSLRQSFQYPIGIGTGNNGAEGNKIDGRYESYHHYIRITNRTKKEMEVRDFTCYKVFDEPGSRILASTIDPETFYNLMVNAGFKKEHFSIGKYGYQDQIYVKPVKLQNIMLDKCAVEMKETILSTLERVKEPYVAFILELEKNLPYTLADIRSYGGRNSFFHEVEPLAKIVSQEENRIYVVYYNDKNSTLDLHGLAFKEAKEKVINFIKERYENFETECMIISGKGNHINHGGPSGILRNYLPVWAQEAELKYYIKNLALCNGGGMYKVKLLKPAHITLANVFDVDVEKVSYFISKTNEKGENRLRISHENLPSQYVDKVIITAMHQTSNDPASPKSFKYGLGTNEHQLTWDQEDVKIIVDTQSQPKIQPEQNDFQKNNKPVLEIQSSLASPAIQSPEAVSSQKGGVVHWTNSIDWADESQNIDYDELALFIRGKLFKNQQNFDIEITDAAPVVENGVAEIFEHQPEQDSLQIEQKIESPPQPKKTIQPKQRNPKNKKKPVWKIKNSIENS